MIDEDASAGFGPSVVALTGDLAAGGARVDGLGDHARQRIGSHLRLMYDAVVQQPVPDRFLDLIARLGAEPEVGAGTAPSGCKAKPPGASPVCD